MAALNPATESRFLSAAIEQLKDYLLSDELFWNAGQPQQLTLGNLLLAQAYLKGVGQLSAQDAERLAAIKEEWRSAWEAKAQREFGARLRQWTRSLAELRQQPRQHAAYYATEVRPRALLELLAGELPHQRDQLTAADNQLKAITASSDFIWGGGAEKAFPKDKYWFLYVKPKGS
jgi:hypothetical protein